MPAVDDGELRRVAVAAGGGHPAAAPDSTINAVRTIIDSGKYKVLE